MPRRKPPAPARALPAPVPRDRGVCPACRRFTPVDDAGAIASHQVREQYHGDQVPLIDCPGANQPPSGRIVHAEINQYSR